MKSNEEILFGITNREDVSIQECLDAMKESQVEAIKELLRRKWQMMKDVAHKGEHKLKSVDDIALELIKEIES